MPGVHADPDKPEHCFPRCCVAATAVARNEAARFWEQIDLCVTITVNGLLKVDSGIIACAWGNNE
jgi:hypothetical protein